MWLQTKKVKGVCPRPHGGSVSVPGPSPRLLTPAPGLHPQWADTNPNLMPRQDSNFLYIELVAEPRPPLPVSYQLDFAMRNSSCASD